MTVIKAYTSAVTKAYVRAVIPGGSSIPKIELIQNTDIVWLGGVVDTTPTGYRGTASRYISLGNLYTIRQTYKINTVEFYITNITEGSYYFEIWRKEGTTFDKIYSEDLKPKIAYGKNTVLLDALVDVEEGDIMCIKPTVSSTDVQTPYQTNGTSGVAKIANYDAEIPDTNADLTALTDTTDAQPIKVYGQSPMIVTIGASTMAGHPGHYSGVENSLVFNPSSSIPYQLKMIDSKYVYQNMGIGSETSNDVVARFTAHCIDLKPKIVVLSCGMNDLGGSVTKETYLSNMTTMLDACVAASIVPVIVKLQPYTGTSNLFSQTKDDWMASLQSIVSTYEGSIWIDLDPILGQFREGGDAGNLWDFISGLTVDGVHPNTDGYTLIAEKIDTEIKKKYTLTLVNTYFELQVETISDTRIDLALINGLHPTASSIKWEYSTDGVNFTEHGSNPENTYSFTGLTANTLYYFRARAIVDGNPTDYTPIVNDYTYYVMTISATGTGAVLSPMKIETSETQKLITTDNVKFYSDLAGTVGETSEKILPNGALRTLYIKCSSGSGSLYIKPTKIIKWGDISTWGWEGLTNTPSISGDISKFINCTYFSVNQNNTLSGDVSGLVDVTRLNILGSNTISGSLTNLNKLKLIFVSGNNTLSGDVTTLTDLAYLRVTGSNTITGDISNHTALNYLLLNGSNTITGDLGVNNVVNGITVIDLSPCCINTYTGGAIWSNCACTIKPSTGYGLDVAETRALLIDMYNSNAITSKTIDFNATANSSMSDKTQGGIWGDFSGDPAPSTLSVALKNLKVTRSNAMYIRGLAFPVATGDGTGFPAGFGDWWRS